CTPVTVFQREIFGYGNERAMKVYIQDESAQAVLLCFNLNRRKWMEKQLEIGTKHMVCGKFYYKNGEIQSSSFDYGSITSNKKFGVILPIYPLSAGVKQQNIRELTSKILRQYGINIEDELPKEIINRYDLLSKKTALRAIHFPASMEELEKAKQTIIYEELFYLEAIIGKRAIERKRNKKNIKNEYTNVNESNLQKQLLQRLSFELTKGQTAAINEINLDMRSPIPMARLLQGDVGSGKTLVSFMAALLVVEKGDQAAVMAPTELLARQHAQNAASLLEPLGVRIVFLTGNIKAAGRKELLKNLAAGLIDIVIGTHALFSNDVQFKNLKLVVIDEQHRFGVTQRSLVMSKGDNPNLLMMSATPIPRTLALTVFGDMDVSVIKDMPPGRKPVETHLTKQSNVGKTYEFVRNELEKGRQAYFVYPLIEGADDLKDAVSMKEQLEKEIFPGYKIALIHSKLTEEEKRMTMDDFRKGEIKVLAATSVVEVGVDVPNAVCMVIEHAERFGLLALHQLRGRVGRGKDQSYCFLIYNDEYTEDAKMRLLVMLNNNDGFKIAEEDLKLRGPGHIAGTEQSGYFILGLADPMRDIQELEKAREDVFAILENDPDLLLSENRIIARVLEEAPPFSDVNF
ncbi:MAG: ATP-dependent DNA helicase RecG, partial [Treponema sp.]|nr:ATP-dependent DNA helicase RecG [Treponema sp.]